jgi:hypothetical protein
MAYLINKPTTNHATVATTTFQPNTTGTRTLDLISRIRPNSSTLIRRVDFTGRVASRFAECCIW